MTDQIFSRHRRYLARARALSASADSQWLLDHMAQELVDRLGFITHETRRALVFGHGATQLRTALSPETLIQRADLIAGPEIDIVADEDRLLLPEGSVDLILACGTLDTVDDLPGALILIRRALRPGGLFLGAMLGAGSLAGLRSAVQAAELATGAPSGLRFHPQIEVRAAGDLLFRAGFSTPVADQDTLSVRYSSFANLRADLAGTGARIALKQPAYLSRAVATHLFSQMNNGPFDETFAPIFMTGWIPVSGEKRPAGPVKMGR